MSAAASEDSAATFSAAGDQEEVEMIEHTELLAHTTKGATPAEANFFSMVVYPSSCRRS